MLGLGNSSVGGGENTLSDGGQERLSRLKKSYFFKTRYKHDLNDPTVSETLGQPPWGLTGGKIPTATDNLSTYVKHIPDVYINRGWYNNKKYTEISYKKQLYQLKNATDVKVHLVALLNLAYMWVRMHMQMARDTQVKFTATKLGEEVAKKINKEDILYMRNIINNNNRVQKKIMSKKFGRLKTFEDAYRIVGTYMFYKFGHLVSMDHINHLNAIYSKRGKKNPYYYF